MAGAAGEEAAVAVEAQEAAAVLAPAGGSETQAEALEAAAGDRAP